MRVACISGVAFAAALCAAGITGVVANSHQTRPEGRPTGTCKQDRIYIGPANNGVSAMAKDWLYVFVDGLDVDWFLLHAHVETVWSQLLGAPASGSESPPQPGLLSTMPTRPKHNRLSAML